MITAIDGRPGQGKSLYLVNLAMQYLSKWYFVYANIQIVVPPHLQSRFVFFESFDDLLGVRFKDLLVNNPDIKGVKILLDEMQVYLSARNWEKLDQKFQLLLQQHRKRGIDIVGATQSIKRADVVFRELVQDFYRIRKILSFKILGKGFGFFYLRQYDADSIESPGRDYDAIGWPFLFYSDPILMSLYDTTQEYALDDPLGRREVKEYVYVEKTVVTPMLVGTRKIPPA